MLQKAANMIGKSCAHGVRQKMITASGKKPVIPNNQLSKKLEERIKEALNDKYTSILSKNDHAHMQRPTL